MSQPKSYYTLLVREQTPGSNWTPQFGDYKRSVVDQDRRDIDVPRSHTLIICTLDTQEAIDAGIKKANE